MSLLNFISCDNKHPIIYHTERECPICARRAASITLVTEYLNIIDICRRLLRKIGKNKFSKSTKNS